jgi:hypothetical protein
VTTPLNPFASGGDSDSQAPGGAPEFAATAFGAPTFGGGTLEVAKPPIGLLAVAIAFGITGIVLGAVGWDHWLAIVGWVLAGPVAIGVLAFYIARDTAKRALPTYLRPDVTGALYGAAVLIVVAGVIVSAAGFAIWVGHQ